MGVNVLDAEKNMLLASACKDDLAKVVRAARATTATRAATVRSRRTHWRGQRLLFRVRQAGWTARRAAYSPLGERGTEGVKIRS